MAIALIPGSETAPNSTESSTQQVNDTSPNLSEINGFQTTSNVSEGMYTYTTIEAGKPFSVSLGTGQTLLDQHEESHPLSRYFYTANDTTIFYGYNDELLIDGQVLQPPYNSLAFDFLLDDVDYTGEITEQSNGSNEAELLAVLKRFVLAIND